MEQHGYIERNYMNLRQLELLRAVIRNETTIGAGRELGLSQPAVSNAIKHLETQLGFPLFERINNRLFPTMEARSLYEDSEPIFSLHAALELRVQDFREHKAGHVRIIATPPMGYSIIPKALSAFRRDMPNVKVSFDVRRLEHVLDSVDAGIAELGFVMALGEHQPMLDTERLYSGSMVCVMPLGHPLADKTVIMPEDLAQHTFIALDRHTRMGNLVRTIFDKANVPYQFSIEVRYCHAACILASNGVGVAIVDPLSPLCVQQDAIVVRPLSTSCEVSASAVQSGKRPLSRVAKAFLRSVRVAMVQHATLNTQA
ncbi:HTH-type transcriptional activator CmpR [compost metagenome]